MNSGLGRWESRASCDPTHRSFKKSSNFSNSKPESRNRQFPELFTNRTSTCKLSLQSNYFFESKTKACYTCVALMLHVTIARRLEKKHRTLDRNSRAESESRPVYQLNFLAKARAIKFWSRSKLRKFYSAFELDGNSLSRSVRTILAMLSWQPIGGANESTYGHRSLLEARRHGLCTLAILVRKPKPTKFRTNGN